MTFISVILGAVAALVVYLVGTAIAEFQHEGLVFGLIALVVFLLVALRGDRLRI